MKKLLILVFVFLLSACNAQEAPEATEIPPVHTEPAATEGAEQPNEEVIQVVASFYPIADFVQRIGGDLVNVHTLIGAGVDPHGWEMSTTDRNTVENAQLFVYNGSGFEHWADDLVHSVEENNDQFHAIESSAGIELAEGHDHDHDHDDDHDHEHDAVDDHDHDHDDDHGHSHAFDSHTWISLPNAVKQMENIKNELSKLYPEHADAFEANFEREQEAFMALHEKAKTELADVVRKDFIVGHESFGYLAKDYGLIQHGIEGASSLGEPDPKRMAELVELAKSTGLTTIFYDPLGSDKIAQTLAGEVGGQAKELNPLEGRTQEEIDQNLSYLEIMEKNINALKEALSN